MLTARNLDSYQPCQLNLLSSWQEEALLYTPLSTSVVTSAVAAFYPLNPAAEMSNQTSCCLLVHLNSQCLACSYFSFGLGHFFSHPINNIFKPQAKLTLCLCAALEAGSLCSPQRWVLVASPVTNS